MYLIPFNLDTFTVETTIQGIQPERDAMEQSLYDRPDGSEKFILSQTMWSTPTRRTPFADSDLPAARKAAAEFIITDTGRPEIRTGKGMAALHAGMNIDEAAFVAVRSDAMASLDQNGIGQRKKEEIPFVLFSMKDDILFD
jgi:hypothetical protein